MAKSSVGSKNAWTLALLVLAGIVLGSFIAQVTQDVSFLKWLNFGQSFGLKSPVVLDVGIIVLTFGLTIKITLGSLIGILIAIIVYKIL
ncbi:MAG: DUF4321 domain-containing protein [Lachnospiraceae bacterium]|nr:DUF4321 domain-containing protein [Lachnospiraceae bacterium]